MRDVSTWTKACTQSVANEYQEEEQWQCETHATYEVER
jgi:hypothetical protein